MIWKANHVIQRLMWIPASVLFVCTLAVIVWGVDRSPPTQFVAVKSATHVGPDTILLVQQVRRPRACATEIPLRYIESPIGGRLYMQTASFSADDIRKLEAESPGEVRLIITLPPVRTPGMWTYHVALEFSCNPLHAIWPIRYSYDVPFFVADSGELRR